MQPSHCFGSSDVVPNGSTFGSKKISWQVVHSQRRRGRKYCTACPRDRVKKQLPVSGLELPGWHHVSNKSLALGVKVLHQSLAAFLASVNVFISIASPAAAVDLPSQQERFAIPQEFPALKDISELPIKTVTLQNGLEVFLIEDHEVPLVKVSLAVKGGQRASPSDKVGLASVSTAVLRSGGSRAHPSAALDNALEELAAGIEGFALPEAIIIGFQALKEDVPQVMSLFCEVLEQPQLPNDKIQLFKNQVINALEHRNDAQRSIPLRELSKLIYGAESVYGRQPTIEQVASIQRDDVVKFLDTWLLPRGAILGVLGDFDSESMQKLLETSVGTWKASSQQEAPENPRSPIPGRTDDRGRLYLVDFPGSSQASVAMGEIGVELSDPDTPSLDVLNEILNSFGGILFNEIRSKEGLAYSVAGGFNTSSIGHPGLFVAMAETATAEELISSLERVLKTVTERAPSQDILEAAKSRTLNSFVFNFASSEAQLQRLLGYKLVGLPQDYLFQYRDRIQAVTAEDVLRAAQKHLHPSTQDIVVVADAAVALPTLQKQPRTILPLQLS